MYTNHTKDILKPPPPSRTEGKKEEKATNDKSCHSKNGDFNILQNRLLFFCWSCSDMYSVFSVFNWFFYFFLTAKKNKKTIKFYDPIQEIANTSYTDFFLFLRFHDCFIRSRGSFRQRADMYIAFFLLAKTPVSHMFGPFSIIKIFLKSVHFRTIFQIH